MLVWPYFFWFNVWPTFNNRSSTCPFLTQVTYSLRINQLNKTGNGWPTHVYISLYVVSSPHIWLSNAYNHTYDFKTFLLLKDLSPHVQCLIWSLKAVQTTEFLIIPLLTNAMDEINPYLLYILQHCTPMLTKMFTCLNKVMFILDIYWISGLHSGPSFIFQTSRCLFLPSLGQWLVLIAVYFGVILKAQDTTLPSCQGWNGEQEPLSRGMTLLI